MPESKPTASTSPASDELYVGYLPVPARQRRFLRWAVPSVLWALCGASFLWARTQHSPGAGVWDQGQPLKLHGTLVARPYPILFTRSGNGVPEAILLVEAGKHGGAHNASGLDGQRVIASGWPLHRDGRRMLELEPEESSLAPDSSNDPAPPRPISRSPLGRVTLRGEIVDSKCYLGAMKPGEGKTHKDCATLCIRGGIPPMFVTSDTTGRNVYILLASPGGGPLDAEADDFIADPVDVSGELFECNGLRMLELDPKDIHRL